MLRLRRFKDLFTQHWTGNRKSRSQSGYLPGNRPQGRFWALALSVFLCASHAPGLVQRAIAASPPTPAPVLGQAASPAQAFQRGQSLYGQGQYQLAIASLQTALQSYEKEGNLLGQAIAGQKPMPWEPWANCGSAMVNPQRALT